MSLLFSSFCKFYLCIYLVKIQSQTNNRCNYAEVTTHFFTGKCVEILLFNTKSIRIIFFLLKSFNFTNYYLTFHQDNVQKLWIRKIVHDLIYNRYTTFLWTYTQNLKIYLTLYLPNIYHIFQIFVVSPWFTKLYF